MKTHLLTILLVISLLCSCTAPTMQTTPTPGTAQVSSLRKLDPLPLYEAQIVGDYGFDAYLKTGIRPHGREMYEAGFACSVFAAFGDPKNALFGRNFDWYANPALILFTHPPQGYASVSMVDISYLGYTTGGKDPLTNQAALMSAPFLPFDGMNSQGLAVGMMAVSHAEGGNAPSRRTLDELELIRTILDYARDVPEALALIQKFNVNFSSVPVHYLIADASGRSAVVEYIQGVPVMLTSQGPWQISTNFIISEENPPEGNSSCWRYNRLYTTLNNSGGKLTDSEAMNLLKEVSQQGSTRWSVVYHLTSRKVTLAVGRNYQTHYKFTLPAE